MSSATAKVYIPEEFAARFGLKLASVRKMLREARLPGFNFGGAWRIREDDLEMLRNGRPMGQAAE